MADDNRDKMGNALVAELEQIRKKIGAHSGARKPAPKWLHDLLDWFWDVFIG